MNDQDRLSIIHFDDGISDYPLLSILPFTNMTTQYKKDILSLPSQKSFRRGSVKNRGFKAVVNVLNQRTEANQATGIFIFARSDEENDEQRQDLGLNQGGISIQTIPTRLDKIEQDLVERLQELRASIVESSQFFIKPEQSEVFQGVEIGKSYLKMEWEDPWPKWSRVVVQIEGEEEKEEEEPEPQEISFLRSPSLMPGKQENFVFDLKIPRITQPLPSSLMEIKVASCKVVLTMWNGVQVVKNADLIVKVAVQEEEVVNEEDNEEVLRNYFRKKASLLLEEVMVSDCFIEFFKDNWEEFKKSMESSIMKDDEVIQKIGKIIEDKIHIVEEMGLCCHPSI